MDACQQARISAVMCAAWQCYRYGNTPHLRVDVGTVGYLPIGLRDAGRTKDSDGDLGWGREPPIRTLACALAAQGDDVHILGHESTRELFEDTGSTFVGLWVRFD